MVNGLIGIDIGTSAAKVALINSDGDLVSVFTKEYPILTPKTGYAEQNPHDWLEAVILGIRMVLTESGWYAGRVSGIGITGQMHSLVCVDSEINPIRPAIIWADQRSAEIVEKLRQKYEPATWGKWICNPIATGFTLPSWLWLREHELQIQQAISYLVQPKDWVRYWMTGELKTDPSDASATAFYNPIQQEYQSEILNMAGLSINQLPQVAPSLSIAGGITSDFAKQSGLIQGTPVIIGGSDQSMQALAQGVVKQGQVSVTIGSGGQIFAPVDPPVWDQKLRLHLFNHVLPDQWHLEAAILSAGLSLRWFRDLVSRPKAYQEIADMASNVKAAEDGLYFLPYLNGERTPWMDANTHAAWIGLGLGHEEANLARAVMEGVVFALRQGFDVITELGIVQNWILTSGGASRHPLWLQLQADIFNKRICVQDEPEATVRGAALAAGLGVGLYLNLYDIEKITNKCNKQKWYFPGIKSSAYQVYYENYLQIYPKLQRANQSSRF